MSQGNCRIPGSRYEAVEIYPAQAEAIHGRARPARDAAEAPAVPAAHFTSAVEMEDSHIGVLGL